MPAAFVYLRLKWADSGQYNQMFILERLQVEDCSSCSHVAQEAPFLQGMQKGHKNSVKTLLEQDKFQDRTTITQ